MQTSDTAMHPIPVGQQDAPASTWSPAEPAIQAARTLAGWTGLAERHFRIGKTYPSPHLGATAVSEACRLLNFPAGDLATDAAEALLRDRVLTRYAKRRWLQDFDRFTEDFLTGQADLAFYSPLDDRMLQVRGSLTKHRMQFIFLGEDRARILVLIGTLPYGLYHPAENLFLNLHTHREDCRAILHAALVEMLGSPAQFLAWLQEGLVPARRGLVIGDMRPLHYYLQTMGVLEAMEERLAAFAAAGHTVLKVTDWCFIDPLKIFPGLRGSGLAELGSRTLVTHQLRQRCSTHRLYRDSRRDSMHWTERLQSIAAAGPAEPQAMAPDGPDAQPEGVAAAAPPLKVLISLDLEKALFLNQEVALTQALERLLQRAHDSGRRLHVLWDGWTRAGDSLCERGSRVAGQADALVDRLTATAGQPFKATPLYRCSVEEKVPLAIGADLALLRQGTAAMLPSTILGIRTIAYHTPPMMQTRIMARPGSYFVLPGDAVTFVRDPALKDIEQRFNVDPALLCAAIDSALGVSDQPPVPGRVFWQKQAAVAA